MMSLVVVVVGMGMNKRGKLKEGTGPPSFLPLPLVDYY